MHAQLLVLIHVLTLALARVTEHVMETAPEHHIANPTEKFLVLYVQVVIQLVVRCVVQDVPEQHQQ